MSCSQNLEMFSGGLGADALGNVGQSTAVEMREIQAGLGKHISGAV